MLFNNALLTNTTLKMCPEEQNNRTFWLHFYRLMEIAMNLYEWKNLPDTVDERYLELMLFESGFCIYFNDEYIGNLALGGTIAGKLNMYRVPIERTAISAGGVDGVGYQKQLTDKDSVIIFNNYLRQPTVLLAVECAQRLTEIDRAIDVNIKAQKTPVVLSTTQNQLNSVRQAYKKIDGNHPVIIVDKNFASNSEIKALNTGAPLVFPQLQVQKKQVYYEYYTKLGIENSNQEKKERVITDEVSGNDGIIEANRSVALNSRKKAAIQINKMFNTNITVDFRSNLPSAINRPDLFEQERGADNEQIYNADTVDS